MANIAHQTKRMQVNKAQATMLALVIGASIVTVFALVASKSFFNQAKYLNKVATEKEKAVTQLKSNKDAVSKLVASYKSFAGQNPNLLGGSPNTNGDHDGDNGRLVLDALPSKYDFPALTTSLEKLLTGYTITSINGTDDGVAQSTGGATAPVPIPFSLTVGSDYPGIQKLITTFERSIRPFQVQTITLSGDNTQLTAVINAQTFYQPEKNLKIGTTVIK